MSFEEFNKLFIAALLKAVENAEQQFHRKLSSDLEVVLHGAGHSGDLMDPAVAARELYLGENKFYRVIDVSVWKVSNKKTTVFVSVSGHQPSTFDQTWNDPPGNGPFKQVIAMRLQVEEDDKPST